MARRREGADERGTRSAAETRDARAAQAARRRRSVRDARSGSFGGGRQNLNLSADRNLAGSIPLISAAYCLFLCGFREFLDGIRKCFAIFPSFIVFPASFYFVIGSLFIILWIGRSNHKDCKPLFIGFEAANRFRQLVYYSCRTILQLFYQNYSDNRNYSHIC